MAGHNDSGNMDTRDQHMQYISQSIREIPDWPKKGILFQDITSMLLDAKVINVADSVACITITRIPCKPRICRTSLSAHVRSQIGRDLTRPTYRSRHSSTPLMTLWTVTREKTSMQLQVGRAAR